MSSEMLDETVEEKAMAQQDQSQEKKKVTVKISPKKRVSVKKKIEPNGGYPAAIPYWHGYDHYIEWRERQEVEDYGGEERFVSCRSITS